MNLKRADSGIRKRNFHGKLVTGSVALFYVLILAIAVPAWAQANQGNFYFVANSKATLDKVQHRIAMSGTGTVSGSQVVGGGSFSHFLFNVSDTGAPGPPPYKLVASGTWNATEVVSFKLIGNYGVLAAGVLEMNIVIVEQVPSQTVIPAILKVVCNLAPAKLVNIGADGSALKEGFTLTIPGTDFAEGGKAGPFTAFDPPSGLTLFTTGTGLIASLQNTVSERDAQISSLNAQLSQARQVTYASAGLAALFLVATIVLVIRRAKRKT